MRTVLHPSLVRVLAAVPLMVMTAAPALAGVATMEFEAPRRAGNVRVFITDLQGGTVDVQVPIAANMTATQKRDAIRNAVQAKIVAEDLPWAVANHGARGISVNNAGRPSIVVNFYPRNTGEFLDRIIVPGSDPPFRGGHGKMDPHSPLSMYPLYEQPFVPAQFAAGVVVNGWEYVATLYGNEIDPVNLYASGYDIATALYNALTSMYIPYVTLTLSPFGIDVYFPPGIGDTGIIWGTTAPVDDELGFYGSMTGVPEPVTVLMLLGGAAAFFRPRRRHR